MAKTGLAEGAYVYHIPRIINNGEDMYVEEVDNEKEEALCQLKDDTKQWISIDELDVSRPAPNGFGSDLPFAT